MNKQHRIFFLILAWTLLANCSSENAELRYLKTFNDNEREFSRVVSYIDSIIIVQLNGSRLPQKTVLLCGVHQYQNEDYRMCDSNLAPFMKNLNISSINITKDYCSPQREYDLIIFELDSKNITGSYYLHYNFCGKKAMKIDKPNVKVTPINDKWTLFHEKS